MGDLFSWNGLNAAPTTPITVTDALTDGTATMGEDYLAQDESGTLIFAPDSGKLVFYSGQQEQSFTIQTIDDTEKEASVETVSLSLSDPQGAILGTRFTSTLNIEDSEALCGGRTMLVDTFENYWF